MHPNAFTCAICLNVLGRENVSGQEWTGDDVCGFCRETFTVCAFCERTVQPHHERNRDGLTACPACGPSSPDRYANRTRIRRHPAAIANDLLDQECSDRIAREP